MKMITWSEDIGFLFLLFPIIQVISLNCEFGAWFCSVAMLFTVSLWILFRNTLIFICFPYFYLIEFILVLLICRTSQWLVVDGFVSIELLDLELFRLLCSHKTCLYRIWVLNKYSYKIESGGYNENMMNFFCISVRYLYYLSPWYWSFYNYTDIVDL